jgi:hypothetical protein
MREHIEHVRGDFGFRAVVEGQGYIKHERACHGAAAGADGRGLPPRRPPASQREGYRRGEAADKRRPEITEKMIPAASTGRWRGPRP